MKNSTIAWPIVFGLFFAAPALSAEPPEGRSLTFEEAYRLALQTSEDVIIKQKELEKAQGHTYQAIDTVMPEVNFLMTEKIQDAPAKGEASSAGEGVSSNFTRRTTPQKQFTLHQPIFSGFKEIAGLQGAGAERAQKQYEKRRTEETLLVEVANAYDGVLLPKKT